MPIPVAVSLEALYDALENEEPLNLDDATH